MILDRKHFSFLTQVIGGGHLNAAGGYAEGRVLDILEFLNKGWDGVLNKNGFFLLTPVGISKGFEDVDTGKARVINDLTWAKCPIALY